MAHYYKYEFGDFNNKYRLYTLIVKFNGFLFYIDLIINYFLIFYAK